MASQFSAFLDNENVTMNAGKAYLRGENVDFVKGSKNMNKSRKPLGDISNYHKIRPPLPREKPANIKSVLKSKYQGSSEAKSSKREEWADEEIEHMSFPWVEQMESEKELFEKRVDAAVDDIMAGFMKLCNQDILLDFMIVGGECKSKVDDSRDRKELPLELEEEILLPQIRVVDEKYYEPDLDYDEPLTLNFDPDHLKLKDEPVDDSRGRKELLLELEEEILLPQVRAVDEKYYEPDLDYDEPTLNFDPDHLKLEDEPVV